MTNLNLASNIDTTVLRNALAGVVILAGGASTRMGTPKAELTLSNGHSNGERLLDYHVRQALKLSSADISVPIMIADNGRGFKVDKDLISSAKPENKPVSIFHIIDYQPSLEKEDEDNESNFSKCFSKYNGGALVAIESALQAIKELSGEIEPPDALSDKWLMVISCDSLIPAFQLWQKLQSHINQGTNKKNNSDKKVICLTDASHLYPLLGLYKLSIEPELQAYIDSGARQVMRFIEPIVQPVALVPEWQHLTNFNTPADFTRACAALNKL